MRRARAGVALMAALGMAAALLAPVASSWAAPKKDAARQITDNIICPCSCGEVLTGCTCDTGKAMKGYVDREVTGGKTKDQIEAALVSQYGEVILGAPKAQGFNLIVWIAPAVATAVGFALASFFLVRSSRRRADALPAAAGAGGPADARLRDPESRMAALRARAEEELRRLRDV